MTSPPNIQEDKSLPSSFAMVRTLGVVAMLSGLLVVSVFQATAGRIADNKLRALESAVFEVLSGEESWTAFVLSDKGFVRVEEGESVPGRNVYAGYDASGRLVGVALEASARGYQDVIRILYGYTPDCECVTGMTVLESKETPGLGDRIAKDTWILANFDKLEVRLDESQSALAHPIETVKQGTKSEDWQIDGITGATISTKAIGKMMNASAQQQIPLVVKYLDQLETFQP